MNNQDKFRILKDLDIEAARPWFRQVAIYNGFKQAIKPDGTPATEDEVILSGLHKARIMMPHLFDAMEIASSKAWLLANQCRLA